MTNLAALIDHTLLRPEATREEVLALIAEAAQLGTYSACISPSMLPVEVPPPVKLAVVCGFPSGAHDASVKAAEAGRAAELGADEIDMVINLGAALDGQFNVIEDEIRGVREAASGVVLKVILETAVLDDATIVACCKAAEASGADFVKTSTGFHPAGGATEHAVALMRATVGDRLGVKASGGIRTRDDAERMIAAGANRLGVSATAALLAGAASDASY
ncbi:MAG: deoxyribose-phosphate aldolase [Agromyces sp.]